MPHSDDISQAIDQVYDSFVGKILDAFKISKTKGQVAAFLSRYKETIVAQAFFNLGLNRRQPLSQAGKKRLEEELDRILPILGGLPSFFTKGDVLEEAAPEAAPDERYRSIAR